MQPPALPAAYLRQPAIHGDSIVFVSDDDLWRVPAAGGSAQRLTAGLGEPATPCLSADGRWLAFIGRDEQHGEVWLMPATGGAARRMTWLGTDTAVRGFTPGGDILFCSNHGQPFFRNWHAFSLPLAGGTPTPLNLGQVNHLAWGPQGQRVIGRNTADPARWKRYRGGTAGHLWVDADGSGSFRRLALPGNVTSPMWIDGRIWFLSDHEGIANLYACRPDGSAVERHTDHDRHYARHAQTDGRRIVYQCGADIWLHDVAAGATRRVDITVASARTQCARRFVAAADHLQGFAPHPAGHSVAVEARGRLFTLPLWDGAVHQHGSDDGARQRFGQWLADGSTLVAVSDADGEDRVQVQPAGAAARLLPWDIGRATELRAAPAGVRVAIANHRNELLVGDVDAGTLTRADASDCGRMRDLAWSPDGAWLAYACDTSHRHTSIKLLDVASGRATLVTRPEFRDWSPAFDPAGKYLYFLSLRTYDPVYDAVQFELSFPRAARPYLVALQAGGRPPFDPLPTGPGDARDDDKSNVATVAPITVELDGIGRRIAAFPVPEGRYGRIAGVARGRVVWTTLPIHGAHGRGGHKEGPGRLEIFDFANGETAPVADKVDAFTVAADQRTLLLRTGNRLRALQAEARDGDDPPDDARPGRKTGAIDLGRIRVAVDPRAEWRQMLREVWRLQRDHFWVADMSGVDWPAVWELYAPLLARVATRGELSDLVWELQGELGTSHAYEMGGDHRKPPAIALGYLAADVQAGAGGHVITRIVQGDGWDASADSPLNAVGVEARVGDRIVAVGGQPVAPGLTVEAMLVHQAGAKVALTLARDGAAPREVLVTLLADEAPARYREWVETNREWVHVNGSGRVGYLHLPDMMSAGFAEFHRYFATECDADALIVDVRYNRGGHVSQLLLEKVARKRIAWNRSRWGRPESYPDAAAAGPVVALANEHAGSDGDIFAHGFKLMGLGPLVGTRTWGGVIGIWPRHALVDGSMTTQPEYSFWFKDVGWGVENFGTAPTIEVDNAPQDRAAGRDRQLEVALATALALADRAGSVARPDFGPHPVLARGLLPPRARR